MLKIQGVNAFKDNYIWLIGQGSRAHVAIVDPGDARPVLDRLASERLIPTAILITHHHSDHTGGIAGILAEHALPVYGPANEAIPGITHPLCEGDTVHLPHTELSFHVLDVPGHTRGHIAYAGHGALFCGDTLFTGGCGRLFEGTAAQLHRSLSKLAALPDDTRVYCAHEYTEANLRFAAVVEPHNAEIAQRRAQTERLRARGEPTVPATLALEKATNPFLRCHLPEVAAAAEAFAGRPLPDPSEVFATIRYWKDTLD